MSGNLIQPNVQRVKLREPVRSQSMDQESYVHVKPVVTVPIEPSLFLRYWKPVCVVGLSLSFCFAIVRGPMAQKKKHGHEVSLASLAEFQDDATTSAEDLDFGSGEYTPVIYSGSEYQARIEQELRGENVSIGAPAPLVMSNPVPAPHNSLLHRTEESRAGGEDLRSMVKFISGLIAVNRPNIPDCGKVAAQIVKLSARAKIDPFLVAALISVESRFGQSERSSVGAVGLMQLLPSTANGVADPHLRIKPSLTDIGTNIQLGIDYWKELLDRYHGNMFLALAAYNWGPANVDKVGRNPQRFPPGVTKYARTIVDRHRSWVNHFQNAKAGASELG